MEPFRFKQFSVYQERAAMKVGTDGILLGAWTPLPPQVDSILDVGAGTGLIALMMAQRSHAGLIDALESEPEAYEECVENFERSPWGDRLFCYHASLQEFAAEMDDPYDLIVCNPPFHPEGVPAPDEKREQARSDAHLPMDVLLSCCASLLAADGLLSLIYPYEQEANLLLAAKKTGLLPQQLCRIKGKASGPVIRSMVVLGREAMPLLTHEMAIREAHGGYSPDFKKLTADFYLKM